MISIVCAYYNRKKLFYRTLQSIEEQIKKTKIAVEVIAVDDASNDDERLEDLITQFPFLKIIRLEKDDKWYFNSCIPFNIGFREVKGDIVIIQNPECLHFGNILAYVKKHLTEKNYISFACFSLGIEKTENIDNELKYRSSLNQFMQENTLGYIGDGLDCWYNHSKINPTGYHFCTAIKRKNLFELGGFDERFARGIAFDDNELLYRIKDKGLKVEIIDQEIVLHQNHYSKISYTTDKNLLDDETYQKRLQLAERNKLLFEEVTKSQNKWKANILKKEEKPKTIFQKIFRKN